MKDPQQERQGYQLLLGHFVPQRFCFQYGCRQPSQLNYRPQTCGGCKRVPQNPRQLKSQRLPHSIRGECSQLGSGESPAEPLLPGVVDTMMRG